jgi:hypothetical protein
MFKAIAFALVFAAAMIVSPNANYQKEIQPVIVSIALADVVPCPEPTVLVVKPLEAKAPVQLKAKKKIIKKEIVKKKFAPNHHKSKVSHHHKSIPSHGSHGPTKIPTSHAPPHLTSPPGCG